MSTNLFDLYASPETLHGMTEAAVSKATSSDAVKREAEALRAFVVKALESTDTPEAFTTLVSDFTARFGSLENVRREAEVRKALQRILSTVTRTLIREALSRDLVGKGKVYASNRALATALGVSPSWVTACSPKPRNAEKSAAGRASAEKRNGETPEASDAVKALDTTDAPMVALAKTITTLERQTLKMVVTDDNREDVLRVCNALEAIARNLRTTATRKVDA